MGQVNCIFLKDKLKSADTASQKSTASPCKRPVSLPLVTENRVALSACGLLRLCACVLWPPNQLLSIALLSCSAYVVQCLRRVVLTSCPALCDAVDRSAPGSPPFTVSRSESVMHLSASASAPGLYLQIHGVYSLLAPVQ